jgi:hypothetical protein
MMESTNAAENISQFVYFLPEQNQPVPPAQGSLVRAWVDVIIHPTRHAFAAWGSRASRQWIVLSLIVGFVLSESGYLVYGYRLLAVMSASARSQSLQLLATSWGWSLIIALDLAFDAIALVLFLWVVARSMPATWGTMRTRMERVLRPLSLAFVGIGLTEMVCDLIFAVLNTAARNAVGVEILALAATYEAVLFLHSASVGGYKKRRDIVMVLVFVVIVLFPLSILKSLIS